MEFQDSRFKLEEGSRGQDEAGGLRIEDGNLPGALRICTVSPALGIWVISSLGHWVFFHLCFVCVHLWLKWISQRALMNLYGFKVVQGYSSLFKVIQGYSRLRPKKCAGWKIALENLMLKKPEDLAEAYGISRGASLTLPFVFCRLPVKLARTIRALR